MAHSAECKSAATPCKYILFYSFVILYILCVRDQQNKKENRKNCTHRLHIRAEFVVAFVAALKRKNCDNDDDGDNEKKSAKK